MGKNRCPTIINETWAIMSWSAEHRLPHVISWTLVPNFPCSLFEQLTGCSSLSYFGSFKNIWKCGIHSNLQFFSRSAKKDRINTCGLMQKKRATTLLSPYWCYLCKEDGESISHLLPWECHSLYKRSFTSPLQTTHGSIQGVIWVKRKL